MDPATLVIDPAKKALSSGTRLLGPLLAQAGMLSSWAGWGGRPSDALLRLAIFLGIPTTWIDNARLWVDDPVRHDGLVCAALVATGLLVLSLGHWAGGWLGDQEARRWLLQRQVDDEKARNRLYRSWSAYNISRSTGTGTSIWLGVAALMELQALSDVVVLAGAAAAASLAAIVHWIDRRQASPRDRPSLGESFGITLMSLGGTALSSLGISLISPELRLVGWATQAPITPRTDDD